MAEEEDAVKRSLQVNFQDRDFSGHHVNSLDITVDNYSFSIFGGCDEAQIIVTGNELGVLDILNWLRRPVTIYELRGIPVWWGYVHEVTIEQDNLDLSVSLDLMANRVSVAYSFVEPGSQTVGTRKTTTWADNLDSQAVYGVKEFRAATGGMNSASAENYRNTILNSRAWPYSGVALNTKSRRRGSAGPHKMLSANLRCKGWWNTLGWRHFSNSNTASTATTDQIAAIILACAQFTMSYDITFASGIAGSEYRDGDATALAEILSLMKTGTSYGRRMLSEVLPNRIVRIYEEPDLLRISSNADTLYFMDSQSRLFGKNGTIVDEYTPPVGKWCQLKDMYQSVLDLTKLADPTFQFIEASSWSATYGAQYRFRGQPDTASLLAIGG